MTPPVRAALVLAACLAAASGAAAQSVVGAAPQSASGAAPQTAAAPPPFRGVAIEVPVDAGPATGRTAADPDAVAARLARLTRDSAPTPLPVLLVTSRTALEPAPGRFDFAALDARLAPFRDHPGLDVYLDLRAPMPAERDVPAWLAWLRATVGHAPGVVRGVVLGRREDDQDVIGRPAAREAAYALKAAAVDLRATAPDLRLVLGGLTDADAAWLRALYDEDVAPYLDGIAARADAGSASLVHEAETRDPTAIIAVLGVPLGAPGQAARRLTDAYLTHAGTPVTVVGVRGDAAAVAAALPALAALGALAGQPMTTLDARTARVALRDGPRDVTTDVPHRLLFGLDTASTYFVYAGTPAALQLTITEPTGDAPVILAPALGTRQPPTQFSWDADTRLATLTLPAAEGWRVVDWSLPGGPVRVERTGVSTSVLPSLAEIIARHQQARAAQAARVDRWIASATMIQHFRPAVPDTGFDVVTENRFFSSRDVTEFEELTFRFNGTEWGADRPPFPLLQAEKVLSLPLDLRLTSDYRYGFEGVETVGGRECYVIRFAPVSEARSLYRGTVWIDRDTFLPAKLETLQTQPGAPVLTSEETQRFAAVGQVDGRDVVLPVSLSGRQTFLIAGRSLLVERRIDFHGFALNPDDFEARRAAARQSDRIMYRDTARGLRYLVKRDDVRVVDDRPTTRAKALLLGITVDPAYDFPLPMGGLDYLNFAFHGPDTQLAVLFGGVLALVNVQRPNLLGSRVDGSADLFAIAVPASDRVYDASGERPGERVLTIPFTTGLNIGGRLTASTRLTASYQFRFDAFFHDTTTDPGFVTPQSTATHGAIVGLEWKHAGFAAAATWAGHARTDWAPWGGPGDYDPDHRTYSRRSVSLSRDFFSGVHAVHLNAAYYGGHDLDRFSAYQFGFFDEHKVHGVPSAGVRFAELGMVRASYTFNLFDQYRAEVAVDRAWGRSGPDGGGWEGLTGIGVGFQMRGPKQTMLRGDVGRSFLPRRYRKPGSLVFQFQVLKPL